MADGASCFSNLGRIFSGERRTKTEMDASKRRHGGFSPDKSSRCGLGLAGEATFDMPVWQAPSRFHSRSCWLCGLPVTGETDTRGRRNGQSRSWPSDDYPGNIPPIARMNTTLMQQHHAGAATSSAIY